MMCSEWQSVILGFLAARVHFVQHLAPDEGHLVHEKELFAVPTGLQVFQRVGADEGD
jgi:hypothetical protein